MLKSFKFTPLSSQLSALSSQLSSYAGNPNDGSLHVARVFLREEIQQRRLLDRDPAMEEAPRRSGVGQQACRWSRVIKLTE